MTSLGSCRLSVSSRYWEEKVLYDTYLSSTGNPLLPSLFLLPRVAPMVIIRSLIRSWRAVVGSAVVMNMTRNEAHQGIFDVAVVVERGAMKSGSDLLLTRIG